MKGVDRVSYQVHGDSRGSLIALECCRNIPFDIRRIYYIFATGSDVVRGKHAHKNLKQILICVSGSCSVLLDNGIEREVVRLENPWDGIYIHGLVWREMMDFSADCVLLALVDQLFNQDDYIYDYKAVRNSAGKDEE